MLEEQKDLSQTAEKLRSEQEVPFLTPKWLNVLESDYIDAYDDVLDVLEDAPRINAADILKHRPAGSID